MQINHIDNPRKELEEHYYNAKHQGLTDMGLKPNFMTEDVLSGMLHSVIRYQVAYTEKNRAQSTLEAGSIETGWLRAGVGLLGLR